MMRRIAVAAVLLVLQVASARAESPLTGRTLRVDYIFSGTDKTTEISVDELRSVEGWAGRNVNMAAVPLTGNGQIAMRDASTGEILYRNAFSTLFQEWQATEEATRIRRSFENVFLLPMPAVPVEITVELYGFKGNVTGSLTHRVDPDDILIRPASLDDVPPHRYILHNGPSDTHIDVAIVAEGYTADDMPRFWADAQAAVDALRSHEPFASMIGRFNFIAVGAPSRDSGVSIPKKGLWKSTAISSNFDTFYMDRYLTTLKIKDLHDLLAGIPYEHIIILANTDNYGGGGIYNSYTLTTAHHKDFKPVVVHEFGHSFAGLADEYFYDDQFVEYYYPDTEPWEQNITTRKDFSMKWEDMMGRDGVDLFEGGGYQSKGVWRPADDCRMRTNKAPSFCPVCIRAIERMIRFYTEEL